MQYSAVHTLLSMPMQCVQCWITPNLRCSAHAICLTSRLCLQVQRFEAGERQRYFADDDKRSLDDLVREQRYEGAANTDSNMANNIMRKGKRFRCMGLCAGARGA